MRVRRRFRLRMPHDFLGKVGLTAHSHEKVQTLVGEERNLDVLYRQQ